MQKQNLIMFQDTDWNVPYGGSNVSNELLDTT